MERDRVDRRDEEPVSVSVLSAIAAHRGVDITKLNEPLSGVIDPDVLDRLFLEASGRVAFDYLTYSVTVDIDWDRAPVTIVDVTENDSLEHNGSRSFSLSTDIVGAKPHDVFHVTFDAAEDAVTDVVVRSIAAILDEQPLNLRPLGEVIDLDGLESLVTPGAPRSGTDVVVSFEYENCHVTVDTSGHLRIGLVTR